MAVTNSKVLFCYVPHNKTMPATPDANTVYFLEDAQELWVGNKLIASNAMTEPPTFNIVGSGDFIANAEYDSSTNTLTLTKSTLPVYTITKQQTADTGYSATYQMFKDGVATGDKINIPLDMVIESAEYKVVETADVPYEGAEVGDPYIDFTIANSDQTHLYVPLKGLVDVYTGGTHITVTGNVINHDSQGSDTSTPLGPDVPTPGQGQTGAINVSGQVAYDSLGHVISVTAKNIYSAVKAVADASAAEVGADKIDKIDNPTGNMIARSTASGGVAESTVSVSDLTGALSDIADLQTDKMDKIADAEGSKILISNANGEAVETDFGILDDEHEQGFVTGYISPNGVGFNGMIPIWSEDIRSLVNSSVDIDDVLTKIDNAAGDKILISNSDGTIAESDVSLDDKMDIIDDANGGKVVVSAQDGSVVESNLEVSDIATTTELEGKIDVIFGATGGNIAVTTSSGGVSESDTAISDLATQTDLGGKMDKISNADGDKVLMSNANGEAVEGLPLASGDTSGIITGYFLDGASSGDIMVYDSARGDIRTDGVNISDLATASDLSDLQSDVSDIASDLGNLETLVGTIPAGSSATTIVDYAQEVADAAAGDAVGDLDLAQVGGSGYYVTTIAQADGQVSASATQADTIVTNASSNLVTSGAVYTAVSNATATWTVVE